MKAIRLPRAGARLQNADIPHPLPGPGEVAIDIAYAGICHSDAHYRAGAGRTRLPITLGHEISGTIAEAGEGVDLWPGDRVALHYLISCGQCVECRRGGEQFCSRGAMIGKDRDGGYAQRIVVPARNAVRVPEEVPLDQAAIMMCSTATAFHALRLSRIRQNESLAILGFGGLGVSAVPLAGTLDVSEIFVVDRVAEKLAIAESLGAMAVDASRGDVGDALLHSSGGRGVDVILEFTGNPAVCRSALNALAPGGRLMIVAIDLRSLTIDPYRDLLSRERSIIGCSDHTRSELVELLDLARRGEIDLSHAVTRRVPLDAEAISEVLDELEQGTSQLRSVIEVDPLPVVEEERADDFGT